MAGRLRALWHYACRSAAPQGTSVLDAAADNAALRQRSPQADPLKCTLRHFGRKQNAFQEAFQKWSNSNSVSISIFVFVGKISITTWLSKSTRLGSLIPQNIFGDNESEDADLIITDVKPRRSRKKEQVTGQKRTYGQAKRMKMQFDSPGQLGLTSNKSDSLDGMQDQVPSNYTGKF